MYDIHEMVKIAKLYYELGLTQQEIAERENISRPTVSRILDAAVKAGIVKFTVQYPLQSVTDLEEELKSLFPLKKVFVAPVFVEESQHIYSDVGKALSEYLDDICRDDDIIGVSWGNTLTHVAANLKQSTRKGVRVVQLNGGVSKTSFSTGAMTILEQFSRAFAAQSYMLSVPTIVDSAEIASSILQDSGVREVISLGRKANIAVFGIGKTSYQSVLYTAGYFKANDYEELLAKGAVGDICSRFFTINGEICDPELNKRTIGLQLEDLHLKEHSIAMACGVDKASAIVGALQGRYINTLFTDEQTAREIIRVYRNLQALEER